MKQFSKSFSDFVELAPFELSKMNNMRYTMYFTVYLTTVLSLGTLITSGIKFHQISRAVLNEMLSRIVPVYFAFGLLVAFIRLGIYKVAIE